MLSAPFLALLLCFRTAPTPAAPLVLGLGLAPAAERMLAAEWAWALRGGGAEFRWLDPAALAAPSPELPLLVLDSVPLDGSARRGLDAWVRAGGLLVYAGAAAALAEPAADGAIRTGRAVPAAELLGVEFAGRDPGLPGNYPDIVADSPLLSPLRAGDALRLGRAGVGHGIRLAPLAGVEVLARSARLSPGPGGLVRASPEPTILTHRHGRGRVVFLSFSPGRVAACDPDWSRDRAARDCSGASSAHALMRWLVANLLWEEKRLQLPLLWEAPGDRPHAFIVTGDVHDHPHGLEVQAAVTMARLFARLGAPLSLYLMGTLAESAPVELEELRRLKDLELGTHSLAGKVYTAGKFGLWGFGEARGILADIRDAERRLRLADFPAARRWLLSTRSHGWLSDPGAWDAMQRAGIGLAFDQVSDRLGQAAPWRVPQAWYAGEERRRLFVPLYERAISSAAGDFRLPPAWERDLAVLASAQADPYDSPLPFPAYADHVLRWHGLFDRLASVGGLSEVWLWHPGGLATRLAFEWRSGFAQVERIVRAVQAEPSVLLLRGDVAATWRANRERYRVEPERDAAGALRALALSPPSAPPWPLPPGAPEAAASIGYWVIGALEPPGWTHRVWTDPAGRAITVLVRPLPEVAR